MSIGPSQYRISVRRGAHAPVHPRTSIIVLVTSDTTFLGRCLGGLEVTLRSDDPTEVLLVANGTPEDALAPFQAHEGIVLIRSPVNHGFAGGCNLAAGFARGSRLVFLNDDVVVIAGWLEGLHRALDAHPDTAVVGGRVLLRSGRLQEAGCVLWRDASTSGVGRGGDPGSRRFSIARPVDYVSFCCAMVRRSAWDEVGGFDERYFPAYYEDVDLCLTLQRLRWRVMYEPASVVHHAEGGSATRNFRDFLSRRNRAIFLIKWRSLLDQFEPAPAREADRPAAVDRALSRAAARRALSRSAPEGVPTRQPAQEADAVDDLEALRLGFGHLMSTVAVDEAYIRALTKALETIGPLSVVKSRLQRALPTLTRQLLRPGLARRVGR